jgi:hypothetical protein
VQKQKQKQIDVDGDGDVGNTRFVSSGVYLFIKCRAKWVLVGRGGVGRTGDGESNGGDGRRKTSKLSTGLALRMYRLGSRDGIRLFESGIHRDGIRLCAAGTAAVVVKQSSLRRCMACEINELVETARDGEGWAGYERGSRRALPRLCRYGRKQQREYALRLSMKEVG